MKVAFILRGVPGSGKTELAELLAENHGAIHSTDSYFFQNGIYVYNPALLAEYHERNFAAFRESLDSGIRMVICDNTNVQRRHYEKYAVAAEKKGYTVIIFSMKHPDPAVAARRNVHNVPESSIRRMIAEWEN